MDSFTFVPSFLNTYTVSFTGSDEETDPKIKTGKYDTEISNIHNSGGIDISISIPILGAELEKIVLYATIDFNFTKEHLKSYTFTLYKREYHQHISYSRVKDGVIKKTKIVKCERKQHVEIDIDTIKTCANVSFQTDEKKIVSSDTFEAQNNTIRIYNEYSTDVEYIQLSHNISLIKKNDVVKIGFIRIAPSAIKLKVLS